MNALARLQLERAVQSYDLWLELRGTPRKRRRALRHELRANLTDAAATVGARTAVRNLGSTRAMAAAAVEPNPAHPRWSVGAVAGVSALMLVAVTLTFSAMAWVEGVMATDPTRGVTGGLPWFPGSELAYDPLASGFAFGLGFGWAPLVAFTITFLLVAQPWRPLVRRG